LFRRFFNNNIFYSRHILSFLFTAFWRTNYSKLKVFLNIQ
jgi:hypothetical protein